MVPFTRWIYKIDISLELMSLYNTLLQNQLASVPCFPVVDGGVFFTAAKSQKHPAPTSLPLTNLVFPEKQK